MDIFGQPIHHHYNDLKSMGFRKTLYKIQTNISLRLGRIGKSCNKPPGLVVYTLIL